MNIQDTSKALLGAASSILERKNVKEVDEPRSKGEKDFKDLHTKDLEVYTEKLDPKADASVWIDDFIKSDAPQFKGKSKEERIQMALGAYYDARREAGLEEASGDKEAYQKFFQDTLKKYGVNSPSELSAEDKKKFFNEIDAGWEGDKEESVDIEEAYTPKTLPYRIIDMEGPKAQLKIVKHVKRKSGNKGKDIYFDGDDFVIGSKTAVANALKSGSKVTIQDLIDAAKAAMESTDLEEAYTPKTLPYRIIDMEGPKAQLKIVKHIKRKSGNKSKDIYFDGDDFVIGSKTAVANALKSGSKVTIQDLIDAAKAAMESADLEESNDDMYRWSDVNKALMKVMPARDIARVAGKLKGKMDGDNVRWGDVNSALTSLKPAQIMTVLGGLRKKAIKESVDEGTDMKIKNGKVHISKNVNRFEVIDNTGRAYVKYLDKDERIEYDLQDNNKTLKVFITKDKSKKKKKM